MHFSFDSKIFDQQEQHQNINIKNDNNNHNQGGLWVTINGEKRRVFSKNLKFDENNQYGFSMTKNLQYACVRKQIIPKDSKVALQELQWLLQIYRSYDSVGHLFCVDLSPPTSDHEIQLCEGYLPLFSKEKLDPRYLSTYQHESKKEKSAHSSSSGSSVEDGDGDNKKIKRYKVITSTEKTHTLLKKRRQVYVFIKNLIYLVDRLKWTIDGVSEHYTYLQGQWVKDYVIKNQMSQQKSTNAVESGLFKNLNNTLYRSLIVNTNKPEISTVVDGRLEFQQFHENVSQDINVNPFACSENIRNYANKKYEEEIVTASSLGEKEKI